VGPPQVTDERRRLLSAATPDDSPSGLLWRLTSRLTSRSRRRRFDRFMAEMHPRQADRILDVGVTDSAWRSSNFVEAMYPWPERITAVGLEPMPEFARLFPAVKLVAADARALPFPDRTFEIGFSNAVIEHVGSRADQRRFVAEIARTCRRVFIATPNARFPVDPHTLLPVVHWLPRSIRHPLLRRTGNAKWASEEALNPLDAGQLRSLFPAGTSVRIVRQRLLGLTTVVIAIAESTDG
jgi:methyltransferase family protein